MHRAFTAIPVLLVLILIMAFPSSAAAVAKERRFALVIGNAEYKTGILPTTVNDAALVAQTLRAAGFEVTGVRDLDEKGLTQAFHDFADQIKKSGPGAVVLIYFAGIGLQLEGENYLVPIDAGISNVSDLSTHAIRLSEQIRLLDALGPKATFLILDAARANPFSLSGSPPACGLALIEPKTNMLIAFNATPDTVAPDSSGAYGPYAISLAEMIREGGLSPANLFDRVRLRVNELTKGSQVPWHSANIQKDFKFFERGPGAPQRSDAAEGTAWMRMRPMRSLSAGDAYFIALLRDTLDAYAEFVAEYWHDPMTKRVRALLAARREAITWRRSVKANVSESYWTYLDRYPRGPHVADAQRLLAHLGAEVEPPSKFARMQYEVAPPLPDELEYTSRPVLMLNDQAFAFEPPRPVPKYFLEAPPPELQSLAPPVAASGDHVLPAPALPILPAYISLPSDVALPHPFVAESVALEKPPIAAEPGRNSAPPPPSSGSTGSVNKPASNAGIMSSVAPARSALDNAQKPAMFFEKSEVPSTNAPTPERNAAPLLPISSGSTGDANKPASKTSITSSVAPAVSDLGGAQKTTISAGQSKEEPFSNSRMSTTSALPAVDEKGLGIQSTSTSVDIWSTVPIPGGAAARSKPQPTKPVGIPLPRRRPLIRSRPPIAATRRPTERETDGSSPTSTTQADLRRPIFVGSIPVNNSPPNSPMTSNRALPGAAARPLSRQSSRAAAPTSRASPLRLPSAEAGISNMPAAHMPAHTGTSSAEGVVSRPKTIGPVGKRDAPATRKPPPSVQIDQGSQLSSEAPSSTIEKNPCTVSNGKLSCD